MRIKGTEVTLTYRLPLSGEEGKVFTLSNLVEAGGIEPPSENTPPKATTCLAAVLISSFKLPTAGS